MRYAETGVSLEVDLSRGTVEKVKSDPRLTELYLGGLGINAKIAWDRVPPETAPFSPENGGQKFKSDSRTRDEGYFHRPAKGVL